MTQKLTLNGTNWLVLFPALFFEPMMAPSICMHDSLWVRCLAAVIKIGLFGVWVETSIFRNTSILSLLYKLKLARESPSLGLMPRWTFSHLFLKFQEFIQKRATQIDRKTYA
jgi:hypothetical protein